MLWRYPEPRVLTFVRITPVPFNTTEDPEISTADLGDVLQVGVDAQLLIWILKSKAIPHLLVNKYLTNALFVACSAPTFILKVLTLCKHTCIKMKTMRSNVSGYSVLSVTFYLNVLWSAGTLPLSRGWKRSKLRRDSRHFHGSLFNFTCKDGRNKLRVLELACVPFQFQQHESWELPYPMCYWMTETPAVFPNV